MVQRPLLCKLSTICSFPHFGTSFAHCPKPYQRPHRALLIPATGTNGQKGIRKAVDCRKEGIRNQCRAFSLLGNPYKPWNTYEKHICISYSQVFPKRTNRFTIPNIFRNHPNSCVWVSNRMLKNGNALSFTQRLLVRMQGFPWFFSRRAEDQRRANSRLGGHHHPSSRWNRS